MSKKREKSKSVSLYSNLANRRKENKDHKARRKAEYLASLPKHPVKRILYRMHPKRFFGYWFSRDGAFMALKIAGVGLGIMVLMFGILFVYYGRELDSIRPGEISKRVQSTVTKYYDRNGELLWEDKGDGDYKLVVKSDEISEYMKNATVAIEDKDFYKHGGFSVSGIMRAGWSNLTKSGNTQGGSTLTQQLIKQVFFADEAGDRGLSGVPRKIKEVILSIQVESMYDKDQILTMYLNESPYGGRRNGVESAAKAYFDKSAKDLTLAESALLAAIPQNPSYYNPANLDNTGGSEALLARKDTVLAYMAEQGYITAAEAAEAKKVAILDSVKPEADQYKNVKAPHFVQMVKSELQSTLGAKTVGEGGLTVKTTLDYRVQTVMEDYMDKLFSSNLPRVNGFDNGAATMIDVQTGQVLGLIGSRDYNYPGYGSWNSATSWLQPGSTIKPEVYAALLKGNYGAGSIIPDTPIPQSVYRTDDGKSVANIDNSFQGNLSIRQSLARSRNIPAIKAMYITGVDKTLEVIRAMGDKKYCTNGQEVQAGLSASIGGCTTNQVDHVNAFATIARMGVYKPTATILEVKNSQGQIIEQWKDSSEQVLDPQVTYELADIMSDQVARLPALGASGTAGFLPNKPGGVVIAGKTGTSNDSRTGYPKDLWFMSYSPKVSLGIWVGNHDSTQTARNAYSTVLGASNAGIMQDAHLNIFAGDGTWKPNDWFAKPAGLQTLNISGKNDLFPSWFNKTKALAGEKMVFDKVSKKKATDCTPEAARIEAIVQSTTDPVTKKKMYMSMEGYDAESDDTLHSCNDVMPFVRDVAVTSAGKVTVTVTQGTHQLQTIAISSGGVAVATINVSSSGTYSTSFSPSDSGTVKVSVTATDTALYTSSPVSASSN